MKGRTVTMNLKANDYTSRVLGVVKEKFGLRDRSEALDRFVDLYGEDFVDKEVKEEYVKKILEIDERHTRKYGLRARTTAEIRKRIEGA